MGLEKFLDKNGVLFLWGKIKAAFATKDSATSTENGLMSSADKVKLDGIATGANKYVHPSYTPKESGLYKITVDATGHVSAVELVAKADITGLGIPESDTTYEVFGSNKDGLVPGCTPNQMTNMLYLTNHGTWTGIDRLSGFTLDELSDTVYTGILYLQAGDNVTVEPVTNEMGAPGIKISATGGTQSYNPATQIKDGLMSSADKTKLDGLPTNDSLATTYAKKSDITNMYRYRGSVAAAANLPTTGLTAGDVYNIDAASSYGPAGTNVAWTGTTWDALGGLLTIDAITNAELDEICV